jgi:hypothetical protein
MPPLEVAHSISEANKFYLFTTSLSYTNFAPVRVICASNQSSIPLQALALPLKLLPIQRYTFSKSQLSTTLADVCKGAPLRTRTMG